MSLDETETDKLLKLWNFYSEYVSWSIYLSSILSAHIFRIAKDMRKYAVHLFPTFLLKSLAQDSYKTTFYAMFLKACLHHCLRLRAENSSVTNNWEYKYGNTKSIPHPKKGGLNMLIVTIFFFFFFTTLNSSTWPTANCSTQSSIWEPQTIYGDAIYSCVCTGTTATVGFTLTYIFLLLFVVFILLASCSLRNENWFHRLWQYRLKIWIVFDVIPLGFNGGKSKLHQPRTLCPCRVANHISNVGYNVVPC